MIETKSDLRNAIREFLAESDTPDQTIDLFISLAEADMGRRIRLLVDEAEQDLILTASGEVFLPSGFRQLRAATLKEFPEWPLELWTRWKVRAMRAEGNGAGPGRPRYYSIEGRGDAGLPTLVVAPIPDTTYTVTVLYERTCELQDDDSSNAMLLRHLDAYLYGSLLHAEGYLENPQNVGTYAGMFGAAMVQIEADEISQGFAGSPMVMESPFDDNRLTRWSYR